MQKVCDFFVFLHFLPSSSKRSYVMFGLTVECLFCNTACLKFIVIIIIIIIIIKLVKVQDC